MKVKEKFRSMIHMKKSYLKLFTFLALILILTVGLTYLSFNQLSKSKNLANKTKMDVALVNEDKGASFNQTELDFGNAFVKSLDKDEEQNWHVVNRGIAENGLERGTYDMMIVIPNDFSEKALSINEEKPEKVVLDYKINASDNDNIRAKAEDTASSILNDMNRRIIDVYFASIIGNLQNAQDHITDIIDLDADFADRYNQAIHTPLSNYTDRFDSIKLTTNTVKGNFENYEEMMDALQESLVGKIDLDETYQSGLKEANHITELLSGVEDDFAVDFQQFAGNMHANDVETNMKNLKIVNSYIKSQFEESDEDFINIASDTKLLKHRLEKALIIVNEANENLDHALASGFIDEQVEEKLSHIIENEFDDANEFSSFFVSQDEKMKSKIRELIVQLPTMNEASVEQSDLSPTMKQEIKNVISLTRKYDKEKFDEHLQLDGKDDDIFSGKIQSYFTHLKSDGVTLTDTVEIPESEEGTRTFVLRNIPDHFHVHHLELTEPNGNTIEITEGFHEKVLLTSNDAGTLTVQLHVTLEDTVENKLENFDLYSELADWGWAIDQVDISDGAQERADNTTNQKEKQQETTSNLTETKEKKVSLNQNEEDNVDTKESLNNKNDEANEEENKEEALPESQHDETEQLPEIEKIEIHHNHIEHQVSNPVIDDSTIELIQTLEASLSPYQQLLSLYEMYFDVELACYDGCPTVNDIGSLKEEVKESSLYYLFNEVSVKEVLSNYVLHNITNSVKHAVRKPLEAHQERMNHYRDFIQETDANAEDLFKKVEKTKKETEQLNTDIETTLLHISNWREKATELLDQQDTIQVKSGEMQEAVMMISHEFDPLFTQSQSLVEQSLNTMNSAEHVYKTFDKVEEEADSIQKSGTELIEQAKNLSVDMSNKLIEDQDFAENFQSVLENSRIGEQKNEDLYEFLSSPVDTKNEGVIVKNDTFTSYFIVLIAFIVSLFTAYVISTINDKRGKIDPYKTKDTLLDRNSLITGITVGIGLLEGLLLGILSAYYLGISQGSILAWTGMMVMTMLALLLVATYLLRQLKMVGMFLLLFILGLYLFFTKALGTKTVGDSLLRTFSPLQYVEDLFNKFMQHDGGYTYMLIGFIVITAGALLANLFVWQKGTNESEGDRDIDEAGA